MTPTERFYAAQTALYAKYDGEALGAIDTETLREITAAFREMMRAADDEKYPFWGALRQGQFEGVLAEREYRDGHREQGGNAGV